MVTDQNIDQAIDFLADLNSELRLERFIESFGDHESAIFGFLVDRGEAYDNDDAFEVLLDLGALVYKSFLFAGRSETQKVVLQDVEAQIEHAENMREDLATFLEDEDEESLLNYFGTHEEAELLTFLLEEVFSEETSKIDVAIKLDIFLSLYTMSQCFSTGAKA